MNLFSLFVNLSIYYYYRPWNTANWYLTNKCVTTFHWISCIKLNSKYARPKPFVVKCKHNTSTKRCKENERNMQAATDSLLLLWRLRVATKSSTVKNRWNKFFFIMIKLKLVCATFWTKMLMLLKYNNFCGQINIF